MYQYPFEGHQSDTSASEHSLGVDLRHQFSAEADQVEAGGHRAISFQNCLINYIRKKTTIVFCI